MNKIKNMKKIFVTKQGGIGDVILATPILSELKKIYSDSYITFMILPNAVDVVKGLPFIDEIFVYDKGKDGFFKLWNKMRGYDIAIYLDLTYRPALIGSLARIPLRIGIEHKRGLWLTKRIKWQEYMDHTYEPYVMGDVVSEGLGITLAHNRLNQLYVAAANQNDITDLCNKMSGAGILPGEKYVVSSPITAFYLKDWALDKWNMLYRRIYQDYGIKSVIFGNGNLSYQWDREAVIDLWGMLNLRQVGELIKNASLLVNSGSMPIHIAAAMKTSCVILYGYTDPKRWAPRQACQIVQSNLSCSPCDGYHGSTCTDPRCMKKIAVDDVYDACKKFLDA